MESPNEERPDGLEILSIGALYRGPWDKKYWSCSRGKDRHPYPIGYHAIQIHAGNTYRMEIQEGLKGPMFMVNSTDGDSCSGHTPDTAWDHFQKKCGPKVKNWHGKRFSGKIDGVELFGFRNPFVQRLLRELVANVNGVAEQSLVSPDICNGASQIGHQMQTPDSCAYPDLLPYLRMQQSTGKRSRKQRCRTQNLVIDKSIKRLRFQDLLDEVEVKASKQGEGPGSNVNDLSTVHFLENCMLSSEDGSLKNEEPLHYLVNAHEESHLSMHGTLPLVVQGSVAVDGDSSCLHTVDGLPFKSKDPEFSVTIDITSNVKNEQKNLACHKVSTTQNMDNKFSYADKKMVDRSIDASMEVGPFLSATKNDIKLPISKEAGYVEDLDMCIPDTLDVIHDNAADSALEGSKASPCRSKPFSADPLLGHPTSCGYEKSSKGMPKVVLSGTEMNAAKCLEPPASFMQEKSYPVMHTLHDVSSGDLMEGSLPEVGRSSGSSNESSERSDVDAAGQELARSMMTFLLPRALPLLKKTYSRKKVANGNGERKHKCLSHLTGIVKINETCHHSKILSQGKNATGFLLREPEEKPNVPQPLQGISSPFNVDKFECKAIACVISQPINEHGSLNDVKSVVPDSLDDDQSSYDIPPRKPLFLGFGKVDQEPLDKVEFNLDCSKVSDNTDKGGKEFLNCYFRNDGCNEIATLSDELLNKGENLLSKSPAACPSPSKSVSLEGESNGALENRAWKFSNANGSITNISIGNAFSRAYTTHNRCQVSNGETLYNGEEENLSLENMGQQGLEKTLLSPISISNNSGNAKVTESLLVNFHSRNSSPEADIQSYGNSSGKIHSSGDNLSATIDARSTDISPGEGTVHAPQVNSDDKAVVRENENPSPCQVTNLLPSIGELSSYSDKDVNDKEGKIPCTVQPSEGYSLPLSESIRCRNLNYTDVLEKHFSAEALDPTKSSHAKHTSADRIERIPFVNDANVDDKAHYLNEEKDIPDSESMLSAAPAGPQPKEMVKLAADVMGGSTFDSSIGEIEINQQFFFEKPHAAEECQNSISQVPEWGKTISNQIRYEVPEVLAFSHKNTTMNSIPENFRQDFLCTQINQKRLLDGSSSKEMEPKELQGFVELVGCYLLPNPVLFLFLTSKEDELHICVICGLLQVSDRCLFIYKVIKGQTRKCPSFLGYTSLVFPILKGPTNGNISFERSSLQLTPDGQSLVLLNSIKAPFCREQNINCLCSICKTGCSDSSEENTVNIVHVKLGYVSAIMKLTTVERVYCLFVCEPHYLVAVEESGRLHVWIMNSMWSENLEEFILSSVDYISTLIELKRIPNCDSLIIGHNSLGGFGLWDLSKRVLLAKFSSPGNSIFRVLPVALFSWQKNASAIRHGSEVHVKEIIARTNFRLSQAGQNDSSLPQSGEDIAVWVLVSGSSDLENQDHHLLKECNECPVGMWRLALLAKSMVVFGSALDPRASAVETSAGCGIIGTVDGLVYMWEISSGKILANLHSLCGGGVACIAADMRSGALAVASNECQLQLYIQSQKLSSG